MTVPAPRLLLVLIIGPSGRKEGDHGRKATQAMSCANPPAYERFMGRWSAAPSVFTPENILREARRQKGIEVASVPAVCVLDPDGDIVRHLKQEWVDGPWQCRRRWHKLAGMHRIVLAVLIALAVAVAPVGSALAASHALSKAAMEDCHGMTSGADNSCCDAKSKCPETCGIKCCKLMGMIVVLPVIDAPRWAPIRVADPPTGN